jgi:hypothetical protein
VSSPSSGSKSKPCKKPGETGSRLRLVYPLTLKMEGTYSPKCLAVSEIHSITTQKTVYSSVIHEFLMFNLKSEVILNYHNS